MLGDKCPQKKGGLDFNWKEALLGLLFAKWGINGEIQKLHAEDDLKPQSEDVLQWLRNTFYVLETLIKLEISNYDI
ncbi:MAG: hypothetical protein KIH08_10615 [Candidatus Freyarchaeota archaeon]|nr:hypothetical protein [Candidatus Jordarchaeia archaeon]MBS7268230.1 hypothetical protein [Candidatus Jordarchaeia archaeon]MBS7279338.1 hypothetical protein [Candidatus Jordarchaeia archaeon]